MLKDASEPPDGAESLRETAVVLASFMPPAGFDETGELAPTGARRMRHDPVGTRVFSRIAVGKTPQFDMRQAGVRPREIDVESGYRDRPRGEVGEELAMRFRYHRGHRSTKTNAPASRGVS